MKVHTKLIKVFGALLIAVMIFAALPAGEVQAATVSMCASGCDYSTIQAAVTGASAGDTINVSAGTYAENVVVDKQLSIIGAGSGVGGTVVTTPGSIDSKVGVFQITGSGAAGTPLLLQDLRVEPVGQAGISVGRFTEATGQSVAYLTLDNVNVIGTNTNPSTEQERGLYVDLTQHWIILLSPIWHLISSCCRWYFQKDVSADASTVSNVQVTNSTFNHNNHKGLYAEKLTDATFTGCTFDQNGYDASVLPSYFQAWSAGVHIAKS